MKDKFIKLFVLLLSIVFLFSDTPTVYAENNVDEAQRLIDGIAAYNFEKANVDGFQGFIDEYLTKNAGVSAEWYIIALSQYRKFDFSKYENALSEYLANNETASASTRLKYCLAFCAIDIDNDYIKEQIDKSVGEQGVMSVVYGLHLLNNGCESKKHTIDSLIKAILSLQLADYGWALNGKKSDVDVTAMVIQSLSPYYNTREDVKTAVDGAISLLSSTQNEDAEFVSYGLKNPESSAQVIIALSALGIDCMRDERFIKNGKNLFDVISNYSVEDGGYCHIAGGKVNGNATVQVFCAAISYIRMKEGKTSFYILDNDEDEATEESNSIVEFTEAENSTTEQLDANSDVAVKNYKLYCIIGLLLVFGAALIFLAYKKKLNSKNLSSLLLALLIIAAVVYFVDFSSTDDYYNDDSSKDDIVGTVTISIRTNEAVESVYDGGIILAETDVSLAFGESVYDILAEVTAENRIHLETNGAKDSVYVEGIANLYEFQHGDLSGWVYLVNGERPSESAGEYVLKDGDKIEWIYSLALGEDIE